MKRTRIFWRNGEINPNHSEDCLCVRFGRKRRNNEQNDDQMKVDERHKWKNFQEMMSSNVGMKLSASCVEMNKLLVFHLVYLVAYFG